ncbi:hypothetical protein F5X68DRAFT_212148 [Plectosphaerella plurivora]|uniref:JmjC domain-containing protein n=1 Tax=Plectosphaerella plurivora TaxID=936078 RepID=A0A9P8V5F3_9PEZI|nr:hypothetical protein F5X68DRAFT_212148 [Plectosphaerella plurivora]
MVPLRATSRPSPRRACTAWQCLAWRRPLFRPISTAAPVPTTKIPFDEVDVSRFRVEHFQPGLPLRFQGRANSSQSPGAASKWFNHVEGQSSHGFNISMRQFDNHSFPYELTLPSVDEALGETDPVARFLDWLTTTSNPMDVVLAGILRAAITQAEDASGSRFIVFEAPLLLMLRASEFNAENTSKLTQLYIAQSQIDDLPAPLRDDLLTPRVVQETGKGDVYGSSVWIGLEPTFTSLHRDPNPNLFLQLLNSKRIRLMPPRTGERLYQGIQTRLGRVGSSRIRGLEMMDGPERVMLSAAVWGSEAPSDCFEAELDAGDALFIPKGWWHSVKSTRRDGRLNASANWWFR